MKNCNFCSIQAFKIITGPRSSFFHAFAILLFLAQFNWTYLADTGRQYQVGLFHGDNTGHLLIYLNSKIIIIDFQVLETKTYSFFIEEELCELEVERTEENRFAYGFKINQEADTPLNRQRKEKEKADYRKSYLLAGAFFVFILIGSLIFISAYRQQKKRLTEQIQMQMIERPVTINVIKQQGDSIGLQYQLEFGGKVSQFARLIRQSEVNLPFPLESGDEFNLRFNLSRPYINELNFSEPPQEQLIRYRRRTLERHMSLHPGQTRAQASCLVDVAYELKGIDGLADFYYQDESPEDSPTHNRQTYQKLTRDIPFIDKAEACRIPN